MYKQNVINSSKIFYTTRPKCAKFSGKNYVVILAEVSQGKSFDYVR